MKGWQAVAKGMSLIKTIINSGMREFCDVMSRSRTQGLLARAFAVNIFLRHLCLGAPEADDDVWCPGAGAELACSLFFLSYRLSK